MKTINLSQVHKYRVLDIINGGMGRVYIIEKNDNLPLSFEDKIIQHSNYLMDETKFIYRDKLAAKTIKSVEFSDQFIRELNIWINFSEEGSVPLLKIIKDQNKIFGIMPYYPYSLQDILRSQKSLSQFDILKSLVPCIQSLKNIHDKFGIIHLDLKPQNILIQKENGKFEFKVSDWGISNLHSKSLLNLSSKDPSLFETIIGAGTLPYMAPERLRLEKPDYKSDIFSIGLIAYEILFGHLPYMNNVALEEQLLSSLYYKIALKNISTLKNPKLAKLIEKMLHPDTNKRIDNYNLIIRQFNKL